MLLRQVPDISECGNPLYKGFTITCQSISLDLSHIVFGPPPGSGRRGDVVGIQLKCARSGVVGCTERIGIAVIDGFVQAVVLQAVYNASSKCAVVIYLPP